jgi:hypothetical protein
MIQLLERYKGISHRLVDYKLNSEVRFTNLYVLPPENYMLRINNIPLICLNGIDMLNYLKDKK